MMMSDLCAIQQVEFRYCGVDIQLGYNAQRSVTCNRNKACGSYQLDPNDWIRFARSEPARVYVYKSDLYGQLCVGQA